MSHHREQQIVRLGYGAADFVGDGIADLPLVEISTGHLIYLTTKNCVIPAKAGIHGLTVKFGQHSLYSRIGPTMDSRLRGNGKVGLITHRQPQSAPATHQPAPARQPRHLAPPLPRRTAR
jgi:hypothetical protein